MTDLIGESRKNVSKFSGLRWFLVFEDSYKWEGSLEANKTSRTLELKLKIVNM